MFGRGRGVLAVLVTCGCMAAAPGVASSPAAPPRGPVYSAAFLVQGTNGYRVQVLAFSHPGKETGVALVIAGSREGGVGYTAPATVSATRFEVDLAQVGHIALDFVPSGVTKTATPACGGKPVTYEDGTYRGTIEIHGEEGFTDVSATEAPLRFQDLLDIVCAGYVSFETNGAADPGARLLVKTKTSAGALQFQVNENRPRARVRLSVETTEHRGQIEINRGLRQFGPPADFRFDSRLRFATLAPHGAFSGRASFHRNAAPARRWTGNLAVDLPGKANVRLTGPGRRATLVHARFQEEVIHNRSASTLSLGRWGTRELGGLLDQRWPFALSSLWLRQLR